METSRRSFIAGSAAIAGLASTASTALAQSGSTASAAGWFGPAEGIALLSRNENPYGPAPSAVQAVTESAVRGCYYADRGVAYLSEMIAERHGVRPSQVVLGSGSTEILSAIAVAWGKEGSILCPGLFWDTTVQYGERQGASATRIPLTSSMQVDMPGISAAFDQTVSLVQICNPNNPTGMIVPAADLRQLAAQVSPQATLLIDEAYNELTDDPDGNSVVDLVRDGHDVIICRTFSKIYGMAGMRVGYAITSEANAEKIRGYLMSFGGNVSGLAAAIASYNDHGFLDRSRAMIKEGREMILAAVASSGLTALPSETNFVFVEVPDADSVRAGMAERNIMIRGAYGEWTQYSRVSTGMLPDVERYAKALPEVIDTLRA